MKGNKQILPVHGKEIKSLLNSKGKSQTWLAEQCGVTLGMINHIITGRSIPSLQLALKICKALDTTAETIFKDII